MPKRSQTCKMIMMLSTLICFFDISNDPINPFLKPPSTIYSIELSSKNIQIQIMNEPNNDRNLWIWGKNNNSPKMIKQRVAMAASGQNHFVFSTGRGCFGFGSNRFGQLGVKDLQMYNEPIQIFEDFNVKKMFCGAEHTFFINDKNQVYSMGLNIKGQLGQYHFQNMSVPTLIVSLLPFGKKNPKALSSGLPSTPKSPIVEILEKFDLQVKIEQPNEKIFLLNNQQYIVDIACGALFTLALSNKARIFITGLIGSGGSNSIEEQTERTRFKVVDMPLKIQKISAGLSGVSVISDQGAAFIWGRFGKVVINLPKKVQRQRKSSNPFNAQTFDSVKLGDQCVLALTNKGQLLSFGQNIDGQLGCQRHKEPFRQGFAIVKGVAFTSAIQVGRNSVFAVDAEKGSLYGWGSNKYGQIVPVDSAKGILPITDLKIVLTEDEMLIPSSYFTLFLTKRNPNTFFAHMDQQQQLQQTQQTIPKAQYKKLLQDYQLLKSLNMALLQKNQPVRKQSRQSQTTSKFQINGITQYRKFQSNTQIAWKELQIQSQISEGGYGIIYRAKWRQISVVVKKFKIENGEVSLRDFLSECHAMQAVRHPNIVMFLGAVTSNPHYSIILEYCAKGSLWSYLQNKDNNITWEQRRKFAIEIAQGVLYLHLCSPPILHRDLKSLNIFLDVNLRIKIGDFGWTKTLDEYMTNKIGTYQWMAPEVIGCKPYTEKADVFSYSIILWQIASREPPYRNINGTKVSEQVLNKDLRPPIPPKTPEAWSKLMRKCWESDPIRRPSFKEIIRELQTMRLQ